MAGGKRKGAGRPKKEETKVMRVPVSLVERFKSIIDIHNKKNAKSSLGVIQANSVDALNVTKSRRKESSSYYPSFSKEELKVFRLWLFSEGYYNSLSGSRKATSNLIKCKNVFLKTAGNGMHDLPPSMSCIASKYSVE